MLVEPVEEAADRCGIVPVGGADIFEFRLVFCRLEILDRTAFFKVIMCPALYAGGFPSLGKGIPYIGCGPVLVIRKGINDDGYPVGSLAFV